MRFYLLCLLIVLSQYQVKSQVVFKLEKITSDNAAELQEIKILGRGIANALDWHPDGNALAVGSSTGIWLLDKNLQVVKPTLIQNPTTDIAWSPNGRQIAVTSNSRARCMAQVWTSDFKNKQLDIDFCGSKVLWNSDNIHLAIFSPDYNEVKLVDLNTNKLITFPGQDGAWSSSGNSLVTIQSTNRSYSGPSVLYTWSKDTGNEISSLKLPEDKFLSLVDSFPQGNDDNILVAKCSDYEQESDSIIVTLCNLDLRTGQITTDSVLWNAIMGQCACLAWLEYNSDNSVWTYVNQTLTRGFLDAVIVFEPNSGKHGRIGDGFLFDWKPGSNDLTAIVGNGEIRTYDADSGAITAKSHWFTAPINMIALRPNSADIASSSFGYEQNTTVWGLDNSQNEPRLSFYVEPAEIVNYTPNGKELIAGGTISTDIVVNQNIDALEADTGKFRRDVAAFYDQGATPPQRYWNPRYNQYSEVNEDYTLKLPNGVTINTKQYLLDAVWSPDETLIATVENYPDDYSFYIRTWNTNTGEEINEYSSGMFAYRGLVWSPNSQQITVLLEHPTGSDIYVRGLRVFSVKQGETYNFDRNDFETFIDVNTFKTDQQARASWNSDGSMLAVALPDVIQIYEIQGDSEPFVSLPAYEIVDLEWSADDRFIAAGSKDGTIRVWGVPVG